MLANAQPLARPLLIAQVKPMMKRLQRLALVLSFAVLLLTVALTANAQQPAVFYGHWPYAFAAPLKLNSFLPDGFPSMLGIYADLIEPPSAYYLWASDKYQGVLAEQWGFEGESAYVITLRKGVQWSDGSPLTSRDLVATYQIGRLRSFQEFRYVAEVTARDEQTVVFTLKRPSFIAERLILKQRIRPASVYGAIADEVAALLAQGDNLKAFDEGKLQATEAWKAIAKKLSDLRPAAVVASGPYSLALEDITEPQAVLRKNPSSTFKGTFETVVLFRGNAEKALPRLEKGELTYSHEFYPPQAEAALTAKGYTILRTPTYSGPALMFDHARYPLGRIEVRRAIAYVLDRGAVASAALGESGIPVRYMTGISDLLMPRWADKAMLERFDPYALNLERATALLTAAGFTQRRNQWIDDQGETFIFRLNVPAEFPGYVETAQAVAAQLTAFGIKVTVEPVTSTQLLKDVAAGRFDVLLWTWGVIGNPFPFPNYRNQLYSLNEPGLRPGEEGMSFALTQSVDGENVDLAALITATDAGIDRDSQAAAVVKLSQSYNRLLPLMPLYERYGNTPLLTTMLKGVPSADDQIFHNALTADNYVILWLLQGVIAPA